MCWTKSCLICRRQRASYCTIQKQITDNQIQTEHDRQVSAYGADIRAPARSRKCERERPALRESFLRATGPSTLPMSKTLQLPPRPPNKSLTHHHLFIFSYFAADSQHFSWAVVWLELLSYILLSVGCLLKGSRNNFWNVCPGKSAVQLRRVTPTFTFCHVTLLSISIYIYPDYQTSWAGLIATES